MPRVGKSPAFQFYPDEWLSSKQVSLMTPAQEGAYIRLLCFAWNEDDCGLPDDDERLSKLSRMGEGWFNGGSSLVRECFVKKGTRLYNLRLLDERKKQAEWREKSRRGGMQSGKSRRTHGLDNEGWLQNGSTKDEPKGNSSSSSSSSSSINKIHIAKESDSDTPKDPIQKLERAVPGLKEFTEGFKDLWNQYAKKYGVPQMQDWTGARRNLARWAWNSEFFRNNYRQALDAIEYLPGLRGINKSGWRITADWFLNDGNLMKIIEEWESYKQRAESKNIRPEDATEFKI